MKKRAFTQPVKTLLPGNGLWTPQAALDEFFARVAVRLPEIEYVELESAADRVLARDVAADIDYPDAPRSAMDGFAVSARATPGTFTIAGVVQMGIAHDRSIGDKHAAAIPTGGGLPRGTDAVVPIEDTTSEGTTVSIASRVNQGENVIAQGADMRRDEVVLGAGTRIGPPQAGVLAALGITAVAVYRRPVVAVVSTGDELMPLGQPLAPGQIRDSNRYAIAATLRAMGTDVRHYPIVRDEADDCRVALMAAIEACDALVITGGSSVGERDRIPAAVDSLGQPGIIAHGFAVKPGKPALLGALGPKPILGLPGNPTSALFVFHALGAPIVAALTGAPAQIAGVAARLAAPVRGRPGWTWYVPVKLSAENGTSTAHPLPLRSFSVSLTARADGYLVVGDGAVELPAGSPVTVYRFLS